MEISISLILPRDLYKQNDLINKLEKERERKGYTIISRVINQQEFLLVYENHLTIEETEQLNKEKQRQNRYLYTVSDNLKLDVRAVLIALCLNSLLLFLLIKLDMAIFLKHFMVIFLISMVGIYLIV